MAEMRGLAAPLTEEGYQRVAALQDDEEMKIYIRRVAAELNRQVCDWSGLSGFAPYYSGTSAVQSLERLREELSEKEFLEESSGWNEVTAPLTEDGYQAVAAFRSDDAMTHYIKRVAAAEVRRVVDEGPGHADLAGFTPWFSGTTNTQTLELLREGIRGAASFAEVYSPPECAAWCEGAMQPRFPHAFSLVPSSSEPGKYKLRLACVPGDGSSLVAIHFAVDPEDPSAGCPMNFETSCPAPGEGPPTFVVDMPEGPGYPDVKPGSRVSYWLGVIQGPIIEEPEGGFAGRARYTWEARVF